MKHTPGPWEATDRGDVLIDGESMMIPGTSSAEIRANARLIAAAPDLLLTLKDLIGWIDISGLAKTKDGGCGPFAYKGTEYEVVSNARAAIAKAEGGV
jgi:hypothetical protein